MLYNKYEINIMDFLNEIENINDFGSKWLNVSINRIKNWTMTDIPTLEDINSIKKNMNKLLENPINITVLNEKYNNFFVDTIRTKMIEILDIIGKQDRRVVGLLTLGKDVYML